jgi:gliding motility-associated-like protein
MGSYLKYILSVFLMAGAIYQVFGFNYYDLPAELTAKITGESSFCLNSLNAKITFEGSGGQAPYTFSYEIDGIPQSDVKSTGNGNTVQVQVITSVAKTITYKITKIKDSSPTPEEKNPDVSAHVIIHALPLANFDFTNNNTCSGTILQFSDTSNGKAPFTYTWNFGDNTTSTLQNPTHSFVSQNALGCGTTTFKVVLTITDANGCSASITKDVIVIQKPDIEFTDSNHPFDPFSNCTNASIANPEFTVKVENQSKSIGCIESYSIDWGDGSSTENNITFPKPHTYNKLGAFNLVVSAKGKNGCENKVTYIVKNVTNPSIGVISPGTTANLCAPTAELKFEIAKWGENSPGTKYEVDYGDETPILTLYQDDLIKSTYYNAANPSLSQNYPIPHSYKKSNCPKAEFIVTVNASNACKTTPGTVGGITVFTKPIAEFDYSSPCLNTSTKFNNKSTAGYNTNCSTTAKYTWDFGDGTAQITETNSIAKDVIHTYLNPGQYTVTLSIENGCGKDVKTKQINIEPLPTGTISGGATVCKDAPKPDITFTGTNGKAPFTFTYKVNTGSNQTITTTSGNSVVLPAPTNNPGEFTYTLVNVQDANGCSQAQSGSVVIDVKPASTATITGPSNTCQNLKPYPLITLTGTGGTQPYTFTYNIDNGPNKTISATTGNTATVEVPTENLGSFKYNLVGVTDASANACNSPQNKTLTITVNQPPGPLTLINYEYCNGLTTSLIDFTNTVTVTTYSWTNSNTSIGLAASGKGDIQPFVAKNNTENQITATITVTPDANGCTGKSETFTIKVNPSASVIFTPGNQTVCSGDNTQPVQLSSSTGGATFSWTAIQPDEIAGVTTSGSDNIPVQTLTNSTNTPIDVIYKAKATVAGATSCAGTEYSYIITVNPRPDIKEQYNPNSCSNIPFEIRPVNGGGNSVPAGTTYTWGMPVISPSDAITGAREQTVPQSSVSQTLINTTSSTATATYTVTPTFKGCTGNTFEVKVSVEPVATVDKVNDVILCNADQSPSINFAGSPAGTVFKWTSDNTVIGMPVSGENTIAPFTAINTGTSPVKAIVTVTPVFNKCNGVKMQFSITVNPTGQVNNPGNQNLCNGQNASINFTTKNSGGSTTYSWTNDNPAIGLANSGNGNISFTPVNNGNTTVNATLTVTPEYSGNGVSCTGKTEQFTVTVNPTTTVNQPVNQTLCNGASTNEVKFTGNITGTLFKWSNNNPSIGLPATGQGDIASFVAKNNTLNPVTATITVTPSINGCNGESKYFTITVNPAGIITKQPVSSDVCLGKIPTQLSVSFTNGTGPPTYQWYSNDINDYTGGTMIAGAVQSTYDAPYLKADTTFYYCIISFPSGTCKILISDIAKVAINALPIISVINTEINSGETFTVIPNSLNGNVVPVGTTYTWNEPIINPVGSIIGASAQTVPQTSISQTLTSFSKEIVTVTYNVTPTSGFCKGSEFQVIVKVQPPIYTSTKVTPITCFGANNAIIEVFVSGGVTPYEFDWSNMGKGNVQTNLSPGVYTIKITDAVGVQKTISETIIEANLFTKNPVLKQITCFGADDGSIALNFQGGEPPITLNWADNATAGSTRNNLKPGKYSVTIIDKKGCRIDDTFTIIEPLPLLLSGMVTNSLGCSEQNKGAIDLTVSGGVTPYKYSWSNGSTSEDLINIPAGNYTVKVTDVKGCSSITQFTVTRPEVIDIAVTTLIKYDCPTKKVSEVCTAIIKGGVPPHKIEWSTGITSGENNEIMETDQSGLVVLNVTDALSCTASYSFNIDIPVLGIERQLKDCDKHSYSFNAVIGDESQKLTYLWNFGDGSTSDLRTPIHNFKQAGTYPVSLVTTNTITACVSKYELPLQVYPRPTVTIDKNPKLCEGDTLTLYANGADNYRWNTGSTKDFESFRFQGNNFVIGYAKTGCTDTTYFDVSFFIPRGYQIYSDRQEITNEQRVVHFWSDNIAFSNYEWDFDDGTYAYAVDQHHIFNELRDGYFDVTLKVINPDGCFEKDTEKILVTVESIPNTFTPNGDGFNDIFMNGWDKKIYNRNGILMYEGEEGWDGNYKGKPVANDTYFVIVYDSSETGSQYRTGYVTVIR